MAEAVIDWLEQARRVRYERDLGAVYLLPPGATATRPLQPRDDEAIGG